MRSRQSQRGPKAPGRLPGSHGGPFVLGVWAALSAHTDQTGNAGIAMPDHGGTVPNKNHRIWGGGVMPPPTFIPPTTCLPRTLSSSAGPPKPPGAGFAA